MTAPGFTDPESTVSGSYAQRIFPQGTGVILLTEDVMSNLLEVAITLRWIYRRHRGKPRYWKLVFFPGILEWIKKRLDDEVYSEDHDMYVNPPFGALFESRSNQTHPKTACCLSTV